MLRTEVLNAESERRSLTATLGMSPEWSSSASIGRILSGLRVHPIRVLEVKHLHGTLVDGSVGSPRPNFSRRRSKEQKAPPTTGLLAPAPLHTGTAQNASSDLLEFPLFFLAPVAELNFRLTTVSG